MKLRHTVPVMVLGAVLMVTGLTALYVKRELVEPRSFADRTVEAMQSSELREVLAGQVAVGLLERGSPELVSSRPLVLTAVEAVLETEEFTRVLRRAARTAQQVILSGEQDAVVELARVGEVLIPVLEEVAPDIAREIPTDLSPQVAEIRSSDAGGWVLRVADGASALAWPLLGAGLLLIAAAVFLSGDRRRALARAGIALAASAALGLLAVLLIRAETISEAEALGVATDEEARAAAAAVWDALAGDLVRWLILAGTAGLALSAATLLAGTRVDREAALRRGVEVAVGGDLPVGARVARGLVLAVIGVLVVLGVEPLRTIALLVVGGLAVLLGLAEAIAAGTRRSEPAAPRQAGRRRLVWLAPLGAVVLAGAVVALVVSERSGPPSPPGPEEITACNGLPELCDRRLDEVVFPGTHNSMAAADRPGWFFANQVRPIPRQLAAGIRFLMIDPHYGVVDSEGRVRTDLRAEGAGRNRAAAELGPEAVEAAERLAGRLDIVPADGEREIFLCHTLCELGAERMSSTLAEIRDFLERNPAEVLVVFVESSVDPEDVEREFENAGLEPYLLELPRGGPLPTLRELISSGQRLIVLDEDDGGDAPWYQPAYLFAQETRVDSLLRSPTACPPGRGSPDNPLFLLNHWIDEFPPPPVPNGEVSAREALLERLDACRERRGVSPNLIAVDFFERGDVLATARELNEGG